MSDRNSEPNANISANSVDRDFSIESPSDKSEEGSMRNNMRLEASLISTTSYKPLMSLVDKVSQTDLGETQTTATQPAVLETPEIDTDQDGIPDHVEDQLLARFRPYYKFSKDGDDEHLNPTDALWYIAQCNLKLGEDEGSTPILSNDALASDPTIILLASNNGVSNISLNKAQTDYRLDPLESIAGIPGDPGRHGNNWREVLDKGNVGLYGHVVPYRQSSSQGDFRKYEIAGLDPDRAYYKIEYWQFFGYSDTNAVFEIGDHEGDWTTIQLLYDPEEKTIISVFHYTHGVEIKFDMSSTQYIQPVGDFQEHRGPNYGKAVGFGGGSDHAWDLGVQWAQNHKVRFFRDPDSGEYSHPVVYIEYGTHEFWPSEDFDYYGAPKHGGDANSPDGVPLSYLTSTPPNLGEVELPNSVAAQIILQFNGKWGTFSRENNPPLGPALHKQWTWPASSSIRWLLRDLE
jgi:hypothetical protein